jgi:F0F1-type ATP synthase assembly protein I
VKLADKQETYNQFGDTLARAFEMVLTPAIFGFFGWLIDRATGTTPLFTLVLGVAVFGYEVWRAWWDYEQKMQSHERKLGLRKTGGTDG